MPERLPYDEAMLFSSVRLKIQDPELKQGKVEMVTVKTIAGIVERPWGIEGGFAVVYKFRTRSGKFRALRCFRVPMSGDTQFRYERIGPYFSAYAPDITAGFKYHDAGIVVKEQGKPPNQSYPVIEMDWIEGATLLDKVDELCGKRDHEALRNLGEQWIELLRTMRRANIAHGDLAGVNVMVRENGQLVLIDYDGVYIPEFAGLTQVLVGQVDYQHPQMSQRPFNEWMDAFSALVIYICLLALQVRPELWDKYAKRGPQGKLLDVNLLFTQQDFKEPHQSELIQELEALNDQRVKLFVQELKQACLQPVDKVRFPLERVDPHYDQKQALALLEKAIKADDDEQIVQCWVPILHQYDGAQYRRHRVQLAERRVRALVLFRDALLRQNIQQIVASYDSLLDNCKNVTDDERQRFSLVRVFAQAYQDNNDEALLTISETMQRMGLLKSITFTAQEQQRLTLARQRHTALANLRRILTANSRNAQQIVAAYDEATLGTSIQITKAEQDIVDAARRYLAMREAIRTGIRENNDDLIGKAYDSILAQQFADFSPDEQKRIDTVKMVQALEEVLHTREYGQAIRMAQKVQMATGKELNDSLKFKLRRATMRFIRDHDLMHLVVHIIGRADGNYAVAHWKWPVDDLVQNAFLVWQTDTWPQRPQEKNLQDPAWKHIRVRRKSYQAEGECEFSIGRHTHIYIQAYAALPDRWDTAGKWRFSDGNDPTSRAEALMPQVRRRTSR